MQLLTQRLLLREFKRADIDPIAEYRKDPRYLEHYYRGPYSREECAQFVERCMQWAREVPRAKFQLAIAAPDDDVCMGSCGVRCPRAGDRRGEIGYELAPRHWGRGFATEAAVAIVRFGFAQLGLEELEAQCAATNARSQRILEKLGFVEINRLPPDESAAATAPPNCVFLLARDHWRPDSTAASLA